jgi:hypothetical protein
MGDRSEAADGETLTFLCRSQSHSEPTEHTITIDQARELIEETAHSSGSWFEVGPGYCPLSSFDEHGQFIDE